MVVTWNVMFDIYDSDKIYTDLRVPLLLKALSRTKADVIGLQVNITIFRQTFISDAAFRIVGGDQVLLAASVSRRMGARELLRI